MGRRSISSEHLSSKYPSFFSFGSKPVFLTHEQSITATVDQRIESVWPYVANRVTAFSSKLSPQESVNYDPEDVIQSIWIMLREKNGDFDPTRGNYLSFAGKLIDREFCSIREQSHTVESPRNSSCRIKQFTKEEAEGSLTDKKRKTFVDIRRTEVLSSIGTETDPEAGDDGPYQICEAINEHSISLEAVSKAVRILSALEAQIIGRTFGLWGQPISSSIEIAEEFNKTPDLIKRIKARALTKIREHMLGL